MKRHHLRGFTLVELMIVVVIIGVLAAIALPSYRNHVIKGSRAAAQAELLELASLQEKIYLNSNEYTDCVTNAYNGNATGGLGKTTGKTSDGKYTLTPTTCTTPSQTFTLTATPVAGTTQEGDGAISISENGQKLWNGNPW